VSAFREKHGLVDRQLIAIAGRLHEQKGVLQLFQMLRALAPEFPRLRLLVMGHRQVYDEQFAAAAGELGIADRVVPTGWLDGDELACAYAAADVFVTPSICFDTFGLVNLEAMEHGKPVVATAFGGSPEVVEHGVTGFIANPFDTAAFAGRIAELLRDPGLARRLGAAGRERAGRNFAIERLAAEFLDEYRTAVERAASGGR
jgi:glycosyltransferase involved in cell wall biosynthesis